MRLYELSDMAKTGCHNCEGCSLCCQGMGESVVLDPLDGYRLTVSLQQPFEAFLEKQIALHAEDGIILPHVVMTGADKSCVFLNEQGRCSIHAFRPGLCRTFPLGRNYEAGKLTYFLLEEQCPKQNKTKVKVSKWIDTPLLPQNQEFLIRWHYLVKKLKERAKALQVLEKNESGIQEELKNMSLRLLQIFYIRPYEKDVDFYSQFHERTAEMEKISGPHLEKLRNESGMDRTDAF